MPLTTEIRAACLLVLLLTSLTAGATIKQQTAQTAEPAELQPQRTADAKTGLTPLQHRLRKRDSYFPICVFCCNCCNTSGCGLCCKT